MADVEVGAVAPVETPVAAEATPTPAPTAGQEVDIPKGDEPEAKPERTFTQKELNEIVAKEKARESRRAERIASERIRREMVERENAELRAKLEAPKGKPGKPDPADPKFGGNWENYQEAVIEWHAEQKLQKLMQAREQESHAQRDQREQAEQARYVHETIVSKGRDKFEDFDEVTTGDGVAITHPMLAAAAELKAGPDILYYLGQHPEESQRIAQLSGAKQVLEMNKLEAKLTAPPAPTKAPPPIVPNAGKASIERGWEGLSTAEHVDKWLKRKKR